MSLRWDEIQSLDAVQSGSKLFLILIHDKGRPVLITNTIQRFGSVAKRIMDNVSADKIGEHARDILETRLPSSARSSKRGSCFFFSRGWWPAISRFLAIVGIRLPYTRKHAPAIACLYALEKASGRRGGDSFSQHRFPGNPLLQKSDTEMGTENTPT